MSSEIYETIMVTLANFDFYQPSI